MEVTKGNARIKVMMESSVYTRYIEIWPIYMLYSGSWLDTFSGFLDISWPGNIIAFGIWEGFVFLHVMLLHGASWIINMQGHLSHFFYDDKWVRFSNLKICIDWGLGWLKIAYPICIAFVKEKKCCLQDIFSFA